jgi:hypothetical protein
MATPQQHQPKRSPNSPHAGSKDFRDDPERAGEAGRKEDHRSHQETVGTQSDDGGQITYGGQ